MRVSRLSEVFIFLVLMLPARGFSQAGPCDFGLRTDERNPNSYRLRGDRCEGQYIEGQSGNSALLIASVTEAFEGYRTESQQALIVDWDSPDQSPVRIRANSLRYRLYYRMDSYRPPDQSSFTWPISILAALRLSNKDVGILAWTQHEVGKRNVDLYLPVRVAQQRHAPKGKTVQVIVVPRKELKEVTISLSVLDNNGRAIEDLEKEQKLEGSYYPEARPFSVVIPNLRKTGVYRLTVSAVFRSGGSATTDLIFYHGD